MPPKEAEPSAWAKLTTPGAEFDRVGLTCPPPRPATHALTYLHTFGATLRGAHADPALCTGRAVGCSALDSAGARAGARPRLRLHPDHGRQRQPQVRQPLDRQLPRLGNFLCDLLSLQCRRFCSGSDPVCWFARSFFMVSVVPVHMYLVNYLDIDDKEHGGDIAVAIEGLPAAFATFTLCWMLSYSLLHAAELPV